MRQSLSHRRSHRIFGALSADDDPAVFLGLSEVTVADTGQQVQVPFKAVTPGLLPTDSGVGGDVEQKGDARRREVLLNES